MSATGTLNPGFVAMPDTGQQHACAAWPTRLIVFAPVVVSTVFAKFALPGLPSLGWLFPVTLIALAAGLVTGRLHFMPKRLALYLLMLSVLSLVQIWRGEAFSMGSLALMALMGLAYVPASHDGVVTHEEALRFFCNLSAGIAIAGVLQFILQFVGGAAAAFPIEHFVPEAYRTHGYNNMAILNYGSHIYKASGFVMLEPSVFCQLCALGMTAELVYKSRSWRLVAYVAAIVVSYSGTGLLVLAVTLPMLVIVHRRWDLMLRGLLVLAVLALLIEPLNLGVTLHRMTEFNSAGSSGFERFVGWTNLFADKVWNNPSRALFGYGSGSFFDMAAGYKAGEMTHAKIIFEFGVLGALLYFAFIFYCLLGSRAPLVLRMGILVAYFMNGAYSPSLTGFAVTLLLWPTPGVASRPATVPPTQVVHV